MTGLDALFAPKGIAVVGASRDPGKLGATMARSLAGFGGHLALVNPRDDTMHPSVAAAADDGPVDLAIVCVPAAASAAVVAEAAAAGAGAAVVCGGGFAEAGGPGAGYQADLAAVVAGTRIRLLGPNTSGFLAPHAGVTASFVPGVAQVRPGRVAVVAASGGVNHVLAFLLTEAGHGLSLAVGLGNAVDVSAPDVLDHLAGDPGTTAVALHLESVADGPRLVAAVRRLSAQRPVVALVVGRHDIGAFAASHTGALATSWRATRAALAQAGAVVVDDERELVDAVGALSVTRARPARSAGVGVVTAQAGPGLLLLDDLRGRRIDVPELVPATRDALAALLPPLTFQANPVDTGRPGPELGRILRAVAADPGVDVLAAYALHEPDAVDLVAAAAEGRVADVPVVLGVGGAGDEVVRQRRALLAAGIAVAADPRGVAAATGALVADARARSRAAAPTAPAEVPYGIHGPHDEDRAKGLLDLLGVTTPARRACGSRAEAHAALAELGGPVAVKVLDAAVLHKTETGGVHLGVRTAAELDTALDALPAGRCLVESMAPAGVDLVLGARRDPVFGPIVLLGIGGTTAEALADVAIRLAPLTPAEAADMPDDLAGRALLDGWRGGPVLDAPALGRVVAALGELLVANPGLAEIEINPLRVTAAGPVALDAVVIPRETSDAQPRP
ncbi:acetate--CoA ligase family protein [Pseudonocardia sp. KRD-184]|uniref:Acetate--CoA ligase family protein n=1 Tax=Pseudonocardia oceani TaxID=2792013 RepID=A0ABS6UGH4_9PSEU|nr:acetate--CoA ligase family protein [Pseudonocardia oceani]MBW0089245.1 acetate--CoA ligase family protein [Pseudonocardia oceani]MBW0095926.1 acetate--CoA ligase family protein [Pseudonocardia oceani]MBW0108913.1 acetate--CoA ligase family protein [Pseudonocardia oceani]MBW0122697.1 acetate--CoA ligase family protein [Pseudonocardia oceani]MBW0131328.1 acetate--CoA ligase family protein [Pseudonocardia oceani]